MIDLPIASDDTLPEKKTEPDQRGGGSSSGVPPNIRIACGQEDWQQPFAAQEGPYLRVPPDLVFGIDFGDETTRIAAASTHRLSLVGPQIVPTSIGLGERTQAWESQWWFQSQIGQLRTRIRTQETLTIEGRQVNASVLGIRFFAKLRESLDLMISTQKPRVVLNVPSFYTKSEREELTSIVDSAGFKVLDTINDYAAPILAFARMGAKRHGRILSIAIGSKSVSIAVLEHLDGTVKTVAASSDETFGSRIELSRIRDLAASVIHTSAQPLDSIDFVILNGKVIKDRTAKNVLASFFPGKQIAIVNADKASAFGAALHASVIAGLNAIPRLVDLSV